MLSPRHQGLRCSTLPQTLDNAGDGMPQAFPKGKKYDENWSFPYFTVCAIDN